MADSPALEGYEPEKFEARDGFKWSIPCPPDAPEAEKIRFELYQMNERRKTQVKQTASWREAADKFEAELHELRRLRPEVIAFAHLMEDQLRANSHKPDWKGDSAEALLRRMDQETDELSRELVGDATGAVSTERVGKEAADVANFAMMIADVSGALAPRQRDEAGMTGDRPFKRVYRSRDGKIEISTDMPGFKWPTRAEKIAGMLEAGLIDEEEAARLRAKYLDAPRQRDQQAGD